MSDKNPIYISYLLRLWKEDGSEYSERNAHAPLWRASLEHAFTHELHGFDGLNELFKFLEKQMASASQAHDADREPFTDNPNTHYGGTS